MLPERIRLSPKLETPNLPGGLAPSTCSLLQHHLLLSGSMRTITCEVRMSRAEESLELSMFVTKNPVLQAMQGLAYCHKVLFWK